MGIIIKWPATDEAAQHHGLPPAIIDAHPRRISRDFIGVVVEIDTTLIISALGQIGAVVQHPIETMAESRQEA